MIYALALLIQAPVDVPPPPANWSTLAPLPYVETPVMSVPLDKFVADEITAGRCVVAKPLDGHYVVTIEVAALVDQGGVVRRTVPRAMGCPTVEQYSAGLVSSFARANLQIRSGLQWYRTKLVYDWRG